VKACKKINKNSYQIKSRSSQNTFSKYLRTIRIHQWIKNFLVFVPMLAAHQITYEIFHYNQFSLLLLI
jgi:4-hydroxybenzoate polyprenyltransferase